MDRGSQLDEEDEEDEEAEDEEEKEKEKEEEERKATLIKSNNPHLAGGEQQKLSTLGQKSEFYQEVLDIA